jgi:hypothetical protein
MTSKGHLHAFTSFHSKNNLGENLKTPNLPTRRLKNDFGKSMKRFFKVSKGHANQFSAFWTSTFRLGVSCLSDVSIRRMALRTHNLRAGRLKKLLRWSRWSDVSRCRKTMRTDFLHPGHGKKRLGPSCLSVVLIGQMVWRNHVFLNVLNTTSVMSMKRFFMMSKGHSKAFSTFWAFKKRFGRNRERDVLGCPENS